nr:hypothetical protein [Tanacetum cinerariifolium]
MFDELLTGSTQVVSKSSAVTTANAPNQCQQQHKTPSNTTLLNTQATPEPICQDPTQAPTVTSTENINQAETITKNAQVKDDEFIKKIVHQYKTEGSHQQVIGNPFQSVRIRRQLESDGKICMFALTKELHQFDRLDVWELVDRPLCKNVIDMKWLWKNKLDWLEAVWLFIAHAAHKSLIVYQMDVKIAFLYGPLKEEVYVNHLDRFVDPCHPNKVYRLKKALYGLKQAPRAWGAEILFRNLDPPIPSCIGTPMATKYLDADLSETSVDQTKYRSMVGALMYLTASRPDIVHATCYCARYQAKPTEKHLTAVNGSFDSDHAGCLDSRKSTSGGIQFLGGDKLVSWSSKKQECTSMSSAEAKYVSLSAAIAISYNPVQHSHTKYIDVRYHFIKEKVEKVIVELFLVGTEYQLADLFTKALFENRFKYLVGRL